MRISSQLLTILSLAGLLSFPLHGEPDTAKGKVLFEQNCALCHGTQGRVDTPTGQALKARNFVTDTFKQGETLEAIAKSIETGVPGTGMAPFTAQIPDAADRLSVAAYVLMLKNASPEAVTPEVKKSDEPTVEGEVSIRYAMSQLEKSPRKAKGVQFNPESKGYAVYKANCAECHGEKGEGGIAIKMLSAAPYHRVETEALFGHSGTWTSDKKAFAKLVTEGLPGEFMPGAGQLTQEELDELFAFLKSLL